MPSPTATMRPTSALTRLASKSFNRSLMTSEISFVLMPTYFLLGSRQAAAKLLQSGGYARVDDPVAVLQFHPAKNSGIDLDAEPHIPVQPLRQLARHPVAIVCLELDRRRHRGPDPPRGVVGQVLKLLVDLLRLVDAA